LISDRHWYLQEPGLGLCAEIDDKVRAFLARPIEGDWPYLWIDATYEGPLLPFGDGLLVDPVAACQRP
jgi:hypothetical protein